MNLIHSVKDLTNFDLPVKELLNSNPAILLKLVGTKRAYVCFDGTSAYSDKD